MEKDKFVTDKEIAKRIHIEGVCPDIVIGVGPSRSGTTLYARIFSELGIPTWYQPLKAILRGYLHNNDVHLHISNEKQIFIKETLGAYIKNEALFNPIKILMHAGVPQEKIHLVPIVREPFSTASSIIEHFNIFIEREDLIDICILCYESIYNTRKYAEAIGIKTTTFAYEAWRDNDPIIVVQKLFERLGIRFFPEGLLCWKSLSSIEEELPKMFWLYEPTQYYHTDFFKKIKSSTTISYSSRSTKNIKYYLSPERIEKMKQSQSLQIYETLREISSQDLSIKIEPTTIDWVC